MRAEIKTAKGTMHVTLYDKEVPGTVANFVKLAKSGFYDGLRFLEIGRIGGIAFHLVAEGGNFVDGLLGRFVDHQVGKGDVGAFGCEFQGNGFADSPRCARNQGNFSF